MNRPDQPGADSELINEMTDIIFNEYCNLPVYISYDYRNLKLSTTRFFKSKKRIPGDAMPASAGMAHLTETLANREPMFISFSRPITTGLST
jgi:hypothetical protein